MKPSRAFVCLAPGLAAGALLAATAVPALAIDPPKGSLKSREFAAAEMAVSSSHVALDDVLAEMPNRAAWERFRSERASVSAERVHVYIDPRSGVATDIIAAFPLLPGDGVGNRVSLEEMSARLGRKIEHVDAAIVAEAARLFVLAHAGVLGIVPEQLGELRATPVAGTLWQVSAPQVVGGITVRDSRLALTISHGNVVAFGTEGWGTVLLPPKAALAPEKAMASAFAYAGGRLPLDSVLQAPAVEIVTTAPAGTRADAPYKGLVGEGYSHRLVYSMTFQRPPEQARWETLVDAASGEVVAFRDTNQYENRQVTGGVYPLTNTEQCSTPQTCGEMQSGWPMPFADTGLPAPNNVTNSAGIYDFTGVSISTTLTGTFIDIIDTCGPINASSETGDLDLGGLNGQHDCVVGDGGGPGNTASARSAFYELNKLAEQGRGWLPDNVWLRSRLQANVNILQTCNAFWNGTSVNFFRSGGGCGNTGEIAAVFDHEWGHGLDDNDANGVISNSSEGYADIAAIFRLQTSCIGHGFSIGSTPGACGLTTDGTGPNRNEDQVGGLHCDLDCSGVRDADWDKHADHTPDTALGFVCTQCGTGTGPCGRQVHCAAAPSRQAAWDLVTRDLTAPPFNLDSQSAFLVGNKIFYQGSGNIGSWHACTCGASSSGCGATNAYIQWLTADDDNGNLNDGTPHMTALFAAFDRHGIACATPAPLNSGCAGTPAPPTLDATAGAYSARLDWSASEGAESYWVLRSEGHAGCDFGKAKIAEVTGTTFVDTEVAPGRSYAYNVTARGTSAACYSAVSNCAEVTPTVSTEPDFSVTCSPSSLSIVQGNSALATCTIRSANGFSSEVALACTGLPADATCSFSPPAVTPDPSGSTTSTLTVSTASTTPANPAAVQILGTSGALTHAANLRLTVLGRTFSVACVPSSLSVIQGHSVTSTCTITAQNDFSGDVALSCGALPAGASCSFSPPTVTVPANETANSTLTVSTLVSTPGGVTSVPVTGTSGNLVRSTNLSLSVLVPSFTVACAPSIFGVVQGDSAITSCAITSQNGFSAPVDLSCGALPPGAACSFGPSPVTPPPNGTASTTLTFSTSAATPAAFFSFQVAGTSGTLTQGTTLFANVLLRDFAVSCTPASLSVPQGNSVTSTCRVTSVNTFSAPVALSCGPLPAGASCAFSPAQVAPPSNGFVESTLTVSTSSATPLGTTSFQATGVGGGLTRSATLSLTVTAPPDYVVVCNPTTLSSSPGGSASGICTVGSRFGFSAPVHWDCSGLPAGVTCALAPPTVTPAPNNIASSALQITTAASVPTGSYPFTVTGASGALTHSAALTLVLTRTVYFDNFETATGWVTNPAGTDTATRGRWERGRPEQYTAGGIILQNATVPSGVNDLVTQASTSGSNGDIDGGFTSIQSPPIALPSGIPTLTFAYYLAHRNDSSPDDFFRVFIVGPSGTTMVFQELGTAVNDSASFATRTIDLSAFAGQTIRILFSAGDLATDQLLEAAVDDVRIVVQ